MTNKQKWAVIILCFILALTVVIGTLGYAITKQISEILQSPAITSEFSINGELLIEGKDIDGVPVSLRIDNMEGKMNSKIVDLLLLLVIRD